MDTDLDDDFREDPLTLIGEGKVIPVIGSEVAVLANFGYLSAIALAGSDAANSQRRDRRKFIRTASNLPVPAPRRIRDTSPSSQ